jgi:two-component system sensor histidine kinase CpxA
MMRLVSRDPGADSRRWGNPFAVHADYARDALAREGRAGLETFLARMDSLTRFHTYVVDRQGRELRGSEVPAEIEMAAREALAGRVADRREFGDRECYTFLLGSSADLDSSVLVLEPPQRPHGPRFPRPPHDASAIIVLIVIGGVLCFALARHVSAPVGRLRSAVAKFAGGDLSARVAGAPASGGDEIAALGRDFNLMAERIESLVFSHRRLLRDVSHELRSPLARIRVAIGLAQQAPREPAEALVGRVEREAERLESLIAQILTLSHLETRTRVDAPEPVDLTGLVREVAEDARFEAAAKECGVRFEPGGEIFVTGEYSLLQSAIENVVRNAIRVSPPGASVDIELEQGAATGGDSVIVRVLDRGPGVPVGELERIFDPFTRGEESRDRQSGGVGLGLAIARRAIESHEGSIRAQLRPGGGLVIEMRLPALRARAPESPEWGGAHE